MLNSILNSWEFVLLKIKRTLLWKSLFSQDFKGQQKLRLVKNNLLKSPSQQSLLTFLIKLQLTNLIFSELLDEGHLERSFLWRKKNAKSYLRWKLSRRNDWKAKKKSKVLWLRKISCDKREALSWCNYDTVSRPLKSCTLWLIISMEESCSFTCKSVTLSLRKELDFTPQNLYLHLKTCTITE